MIRLCAFADEASEMLDGQIRALKRNNISLIELRGVNGTNVSGLTEEEAYKYSGELRREGIAVWSIGSPIGKVDISTDFSEYLKDVKHILRLAKIFGAKRVRMFSFYGAYESSAEVMRRLRCMVELAKEEGIKLCHENEKKIYGDTAARVLEIKEQLPELSLIYDPANFVEVGECADDILDKLHHLADYFHIKDAISHSLEIVPAGYGDGKIKELVARIPKGEDKVLTLEPHLKTFTGFSELDTAALKNKFTYSDSDEAFDAAVTALKVILAECGYIETEGGFIKK